MRNSIIVKLIKYNLIKCYNKKVFIVSFLISLIVCRFYISKVTDYHYLSGQAVNQWDYFFRIFSNGFVLVWMIMPILFFITAPVSMKSDDNLYVYTRALKKWKIVIGQQITNLILISVYIIGLAVILFILGGFYSEFGYGWGDAIVKETNIFEATKYLFFNNFIEYYSPIKAMILSLCKFIGTIYAFILLRDIFIYAFKKI